MSKHTTQAMLEFMLNGITTTFTNVNMENNPNLMIH